LKVLIAGAGAVGGYIGACLARSGEDVTLYARGPHLHAMRENGLRVISATGEFIVRPRIVADLSDAGEPDVIFLAVKAHSLTQLAPQIKHLIREHTTVVSTQNGVPWWYFQIGASDLGGVCLERVDPGGIIAESIDPRSILGSIVYLATDIAEPGVIRHTEGSRISLGEPDGTKSERSRQVAEMLIKAGLRAPVTQRLRNEIWVKLLGNVAFNPISALTRATLWQMAHDPDVSVLARKIMCEVEMVANELGIELSVSIDQRMAGVEKMGEHKTSMLQDLEAGRPMELEAIVGAVIEIGDKLEVSMPHTRSVYACTKLLGQMNARKN
jgi:2-dehydropantoate 2-reductase